MSLSKFVYCAVQKNSGLTHRDVVKEVLNGGYVHSGDTPISQAVHSALMDLVRFGAISRRETEMVRTYQPNQYISYSTAQKLQAAVLECNEDVADYADYADCGYRGNCPAA